MDGGVADTTRERSNVGTGTAHLAVPLRSAVLPPFPKNCYFETSEHFERFADTAVKSWCEEDTAPSFTSMSTPSITLRPTTTSHTTEV